MLDNKFNPQEAEPRLYKMWEDSGAFKPRAAKPGDTKDDNFSIVIPPPNVTGSLHMGHAVNNTIQDILVRYNRMRGKAVLWQPGTDHAGIATQMVVERKLAAEGKARKDMTREQFLEHVWAWKAESGGNINQQLRRLGSSCDWSREKFTLGDPDDPSDKMAEAVTKAFVEMYEAGLIYRDKRLVNWDPHFQTAISDLEVENIEKDGHFWHFKYPLDGGETYTYVEKDEDGNVTLSEERDYISIATTRPETMLGDGAVAVHPDDERYAPIVGKMVRLPLAGRLIPIVTDEYPDPDFGSGAVKITGAHDFNDYEVAKRNNILMHSLMAPDGSMRSDGEPYNKAITIADQLLANPDHAHQGMPNVVPDKYRGMDRFKARREVVADIDAIGLLIRVEDKKIMQPIGDRSGVVIEPMLTDQWFVAADKLAGEAMAKVDDGSTCFVPENWKKTYDHWMKDIQPWCISRQLWWGHQIPAWYGPDMGPAATQNPSINKMRLKHFVAKDASQALELARSYYPDHIAVRLPEDGENPKVNFGHLDIGLPIIEEVVLSRDEDVLDTWFSSGLWPFSTLGWPEDTEELKRFYPTSVVVTAFDIIFFWVARMMMQGIHFMDDVPFDDIYIHALVLDEAGKKMSKSVGNTLDPLDLIDGVDIETLVAKRTRGLKNPEKAPKIEKATRKQYPDGFEPYGADALRFTLASMAGQGRNIRLSVDRIAGYRNFGTKLWSAATFGQMNGCKPTKDFDPASANLALNKWIISETVKTTAEVTRCIESYRFNDAADAAYKFAWDTFCAWYLEMSKPILSGEDGADKDETRAAFAWTLDQILKLLHPFMPFITEELWGKIADSRDDMLIVSAWPNLVESLIEDYGDTEGFLNSITWLINLIQSLRSVRAELNVPPSKKCPIYIVDGTDEIAGYFKAYSETLSIMGRVSRWERADKVPEGAITAIVNGVTYAILAKDLIDINAEKARLSKEIEKAQTEIDKIDKKLSNEAFVSKAPEKVVTLQKERRAGYVAELEKLNEAIAALG